MREARGLAASQRAEAMAEKRKAGQYEEDLRGMQMRLAQARLAGDTKTVETLSTTLASLGVGGTHDVNAKHRAVAMQNEGKALIRLGEAQKKDAVSQKDREAAADTIARGAALLSQATESFGPTGGAAPAAGTGGGGADAPDGAAPAGKPMPGAGKTLTPEEVQYVAKRKGWTIEEARRMAMSEGYKLEPR